MKKDVLKGVFLTIFILGIVGTVFAVGFHQANEVLPGQFANGNYSFNGSLEVLGGVNGGNVPAVNGITIGAGSKNLMFLGDNTLTGDYGSIVSWNTVYNFEGSKILFTKPAANLGAISFLTNDGLGNIERMQITASGDVCGPDADLSNCASDVRLKTNINPYQYGLNEILKFNPVSYNWNKKAEELGFNPNESQVSFIAQDVEKIIPEWVTEREDGYKKVADGNIKYILVNAIKEQQKKIEELENRIDELEQK